MSADSYSCVQVLYDFDYVTDDGRGVQIQEGEELLLVRKTNNDWWQVVRDGESRPFYAPMSYLHLGTPQKPQKKEELNNCTHKAQEDLNANHLGQENFPENMVLFVSNPLYSSASECLTSSSKRISPLNSRERKTEKKDNIKEGVTVIHIPGPTALKTNVKNLPDDEGNHSDEGKEDDEETESNDDDGTKSTDSAYNEFLQRVNEDDKNGLSTEEGEEGPESPIYANFPLFSSVTPPQPEPEQKPVKILFQNWSEYADDRGRKFYFNEMTKEATWKPPRRIPDNHVSDEDNADTDSEPPPPHIPEPVLPPTPPNKPKPKLIRSTQAWPTSNHQRGGLENSYEYSSTDSLDSPSTPPEFSSSQTLSSPYNVEDLEHTPKSRSLPRGWTRCKDPKTKDIYYQRDSNKEKWLSAVDESGREYFYLENGTESLWELPDIKNHSLERAQLPNKKPSHREAPKPPSVPASVGGALKVPPPKLPSHKMRPAPLPHSLAERKQKTHSVALLDSSLLSKATGSSVNQKKDKSSSLPRGTLPPTHPGADSPSGPAPRQWPQLQDGCMVVTKEGLLNKTCLLDAGRRLKKNWTQSYLALTNVYLLFYKDQKSAQQINGACKPEISLDLAGALIETNTENSRRKNVFQITTVLGHQILLQDDNTANIKDWIDSIKSAVAKLPSSNVWYLSNPPLGSSPPKEKGKKAGRLTRSKSTKLKNQESGAKGAWESSFSQSSSKDALSVVEDLHNCTSPTERKRRIRDKLRSFFLRRPSMESLREKGILKDEPVFGCHLHYLCLSEKSTVPKFVQLCIEAIEKKDMSADGLYRASGNLSQIQKIRFQVNQDDYSGLKTEEDVHVLTGALKMFFRDMKEPLFPFNTFEHFLAAIALNDRHQKLASITDLVRNLPVINGDTLKFLLKHLVRVTKLSDKNRMHVQNVAIVFGPTLLWPMQESPDLALEMMHQNQIMELLLLEFNSIYR